MHYSDELSFVSSVCVRRHAYTFLFKVAPGFPAVNGPNIRYLQWQNSHSGGNIVIPPARIKHLFPGDSMNLNSKGS